MKKKEGKTLVEVFKEEDESMGDGPPPVMPKGMGDPRIKEIMGELNVKMERQWRVFIAKSGYENLPGKLESHLRHTFICGACAGAFILTEMFEARRRKK